MVLCILLGYAVNLIPDHCVSILLGRPLYKIGLGRSVPNCYNSDLTHIGHNLKFVRKSLHRIAWGIFTTVLLFLDFGKSFIRTWRGTGNTFFTDKSLKLDLRTNRF